MTQLVSRNTPMMCERSASASVRVVVASAGANRFKSPRAGRRTEPVDMITARSMKFCNSRMFPGHQ